LVVSRGIIPFEKHIAAIGTTSINMLSKRKTLDEGSCGSNAFKGYFDDAKEFKNQEKDSREVSRIKNNQEQDSRLKIQELREDLIKISMKRFFSKTE